MITSKQEYIEYYLTDLSATGIMRNDLKRRLYDKRYKFYKRLRKTEYYTNCKKSLFGRLYAKLLLLSYIRMCDKYQWTIPINVFGKGLCLPHSGAIVVTTYAKIGDYARVHVGVNIGCAPSHGVSGAPVVGDNCYFGPGCKIFGPIEIGDNVAIGANAVVNASFPDGNCTLGGIPAKVISANTSSLYINRAN